VPAANLAGARELPVERPCPGPDVGGRVPRLEQDQPPRLSVLQADVDRVPWSTRADGELERAGVAGRSPDPQEQFLDREVPGVDGRLERVARELEPLGQVEGEPEGDPAGDRDAVAPASLDAADRRLAQADASGQPGLRPRRLQVGGRRRAGRARGRGPSRTGATAAPG
jgi:hypothetical protein